MSQVVTSTVRQKETIMVHSPMKAEESGGLNGLRPGKPESELHNEHAASISRNQAAAEDNADTHMSGLRVNTTPKTRGSREDQLCVCTPSQRVPRPCNSFILYRTRMAAKVATENPTASNPQISKILGDRWAKESDEVKNQWKLLADEESRRHRLQYPDYRFQPRRRGSKAQARHGDDSERCSKCNGLKVSRTPAPPTPVKGRTAAEPPPGQKPNETERRSSIDREAVGSAEETRPMSPEPKRRRLAEVEARGIAPIQVGAYKDSQTGYSDRTPPSGGHYGRFHYTHVATPLPQPDGMTRSHHGSMPPPPRPPAVGAWNSSGYQYAGKSENPDESVRLPPLKTAITPSASPAQEYESRFGFTPMTAGLGISSASTRESPAKSVHEQILSIPFARKMAVAGKICPPLPRSGAGARGAIIAVEGTRGAALQEVSQAVEKTLRICENAALKSWTNDSKFDEAFADLELAGRTSVNFKDLVPFIFQDILVWHEKSKEMIDHIQGRPGSPLLTRASPGEENSPASGQNKAARTKTPVALVKDGFSLTMSDKFACSTSNSLNHYGPVDHWQWMATLWRGIVGPDLVVYVKSCPEEEMEKLKTVEFQKQLGIMVVRVPLSRKSLDESTERRLNFEVIEWITDVWPKGAGSPQT